MTASAARQDYSSLFIPLYLGPAAQLSFSAKLCHSRAEGFSTSSASCRLRRITTQSPAQSDVVAWPSQKSVVPAFTRCATINTVERDEITTGRKDKLCGQIGVMQNASTSGSMIGPPADTL